MAGRIAISPGDNHKLAALFYDQVLPVLPHNQDVPEDLRYRGLDDLIARATTGDWLMYLLNRAVAQKMGPDGFPDIDGPLRIDPDESSLNLFARHLHGKLDEMKIPSVPLFLSDTSFQNLGRAGESRTLEIILENAPIINTDKLTWEHIREVRRDVKFSDKARRFRTFLFDAYQGKDAAYITDSIQEKIREYEEACKTNGLKIEYSLYKMVLNAKNEVAFWAAANFGLIKGLSIEPFHALVATGAAAIGSTFLSIREKKLELSKGEDNEIALLMDIKKATGKI